MHAIRVQCSYKMEAMRGLGVDRHLFGLYIVAKGMKLDPMPKLFTDKVIFNLVLSLSQVAMDLLPLIHIYACRPSICPSRSLLLKHL